MKALVTGGAGFIGSHVVDRLVEDGWEIIVLDKLLRGDKNIKKHLDSHRVELKKVDIKEIEKIKPFFRDVNTVFHFAANADIRGGVKNTRIDLEENILATWNVLESMRQADVKEIVFASSAAVYGEAEIVPTPETYFPIQTSLYGASKLAGESLIEAFCTGFGMKSWIYRFVSVVGERHPHGVTYDFVKKLKKNPRRLEILGDGHQKKSFLYVKDCVDGIFHGYKNGKEQINIFNLGLEEVVEVNDIARYVVDEMGLKNVEFQYTGGDRGWIGDAPLVFLSIEKIKKLGWKPKTTIENGIRKTVRWLLENPDYYE